MKPCEFDYLRAASIDEACRALDGAAGDGRIIAGGQTLVPLMAMRLARPSLLVDINHIAELTGIKEDGGHIAIGACTRQAEIHDSPIVARRLPLLAKAIRFVGHGQTRNRGTIGGSLANADPSAEIPLVFAALGGEVTAISVEGRRRIDADGFFDSAMVTNLAPNECLREIRIPVWDAARTGSGFTEVNIRRSDFAICAAAAQLTLDADGTCARIRIGVGGVAPAPLRLGAIEDALTGTTLDDDTVSRETSNIGDMIDPESDIHASADYRRRVTAVLAARAIFEARAQASREVAAT
jgi:CO/xanthine dehydrogenase FAD-binding subunit